MKLISYALYLSVCAIMIVNCRPVENSHVQPNIILIMADDLGYGDLSCYGNDYIQTPNIDQLAAEGMRFTDYHSNGAVCSPTRAALLSGMYQQRVGIHGVVYTWLRDSLGMDQEVVTVAEVFQEAGYKTGIFGKWHLGYKTEFNPLYQGFDVFRGFVAGNVDYHSHLDNQGVFDWWRDSTLEDDPGYSTDLITTYALDFINKQQENPFFLYLPYAAPHDPYEGRDDPPVRVKGQENRKLAAEDIPGIYREMIEVMDEGIGQIMKNLKLLGLDENTLVFFCSDNGANKNGSNGILRGFKGGLYEGGHRVPAIARWPGMIMREQVSDEVVMSMDIFPTLLELANISSQRSHLDGRSFARVLLSGDSLAERKLFWQYNKQTVVRQGSWKLLIHNTDTLFFNLEDDPGEKNDLSKEEQTKVDELLEDLNTWVQDIKEKGVLSPTTL